MSSFMRKKLYLCFSKVKCLPPLHDFEDDNRCSTSTPTSVDDPLSSPFSSSFDNPDFLAANSLPDLTAVYTSRRFFFSTPGESNSIFESCTETTTDAAVPGTGGGVAVWKYSSDPMADFRRSMQEMVDAKELKDVEEGWDYLHELLICYLRLNPEHTHKFITGAFTDLIVSLMSRSELNESQPGDRSLIC